MTVSPSGPLIKPNSPGQCGRFLSWALLPLALTDPSDMVMHEQSVLAAGVSELTQARAVFYPHICSQMLTTPPSPHPVSLRDT